MFYSSLVVCHVWWIKMIITSMSCRRNTWIWFELIQPISSVCVARTCPGVDEDAGVMGDQLRRQWSPPSWRAPERGTPMSTLWSWLGVVSWWVGESAARVRVAVVRQLSEQSALKRTRLLIVRTLSSPLRTDKQCTHGNNLTNAATIMFLGFLFSFDRLPIYCKNNICIVVKNARSHVGSWGQVECHVARRSIWSVYKFFSVTDWTPEWFSDIALFVPLKRIPAIRVLTHYDAS